MTAWALGEITFGIRSLSALLALTRNGIDYLSAGTLRRVRVVELRNFSLSGRWMRRAIRGFSKSSSNLRFPGAQFALLGNYEVFLSAETCSVMPRKKRRSAKKRATDMSHPSLPVVCLRLAGLE